MARYLEDPFEKWIGNKLTTWFLACHKPVALHKMGNNVGKTRHTIKSKGNSPQKEGAATNQKEKKEREDHHRRVSTPEQPTFKHVVGIHSESFMWGDSVFPVWACSIPWP